LGHSDRGGLKHPAKRSAEGSLAINLDGVSEKSPIEMPFGEKTAGGCSMFEETRLPASPDDRSIAAVQHSLIKTSQRRRTIYGVPELGVR
jgi:hypothetical protein